MRWSAVALALGCLGGLIVPTFRRLHDPPASTLPTARAQTNEISSTSNLTAIPLPTIDRAHKPPGSNQTHYMKKNDRIKEQIMPVQGSRGQPSTAMNAKPATKLKPDCNSDGNCNDLARFLLNVNRTDKLFLYLTQTRSYRPIWSSFLISLHSELSDVICLSAYPPFGPCIDGERATWTVGRNILWHAAAQLRHKYLYYVFLDEDVQFARKGNLSRFHQVMLAEKPAMGAPIELPPSRVFWNRLIIRQSRGHMESTRAFDAMFVAFHRDVFFGGLVLPYYSGSDFWSWTLSQFWHLFIAQRVYSTDIAQINQIWIKNQNHSDYPHGQKTMNWFPYHAGLFLDSFNALHGSKHAKVHERIVARDSYAINVSGVIRNESGYWCAIRLFAKNPKIKDLLQCLPRNELTAYRAGPTIERERTAIDNYAAENVPSCFTSYTEPALWRDSLNTHYRCPSYFTVYDDTCRNSHPQYPDTIFGVPSLGEYRIEQGSLLVRLFCKSIDHGGNTTYHPRLCVVRHGVAPNCSVRSVRHLAPRDFVELRDNATTVVPSARGVAFIALACPVRVEIFPIGSMYKYDFLFPVLPRFVAKPHEDAARTILLVEMDGVSEEIFREHFSRVTAILQSRNYTTLGSDNYYGITNVDLLCMNNILNEESCGASARRQQIPLHTDFVIAVSTYNSSDPSTALFDVGIPDYEQNIDGILTKFKPSNPFNDQLCDFRPDLPPPYSCWGSKPIFGHQVDFMRDVITRNPGRRLLGYLKLPTDTQFGRHLKTLDYLLALFVAETLAQGKTTVLFYSSYAAVKPWGAKPGIGPFPTRGVLRVVSSDPLAAQLPHLQPSAVHGPEEVGAIVSFLTGKTGTPPKAPAGLVRDSTVTGVEEGSARSITEACILGYQIMKDSLALKYSCRANVARQPIVASRQNLTDGRSRLLILFGQTSVSMLYTASAPTREQCTVEWFTERKHECKFECRGGPFTFISHCLCAELF